MSMHNENDTINILDARTFQELEEEAGKINVQTSRIAIWRVKQLSLEKVKPEEYGEFYKGDCYVVITKRKGTFYVYFWLGADSSQDEQAYAAMVTVDIDEEVFGGAAIQAREVNGCETAHFKDIFKDNMLIKNGGYKTAMRKVSISNEPAHLYKVKGKLRPVVTEVSSRTSSLNSDDSHILDVSRKHKCVYVLRGRASKKEEAMKAIKMARKFGVQINVLDEDELSSCGEDDNRILHDSLGVSRSRPIKFEGMDKVTDEQQDSEVDRTTELCRVHDSNIQNVPVKQSSLDSGDCFVLKTAKNVYVWKGRDSTKEERKGAFQKAEAFIRQKGMPPNTQITVVPENIEPVDFKGCFVDWIEKDEITACDYSKPAGKGNVAKSVHTVIDFRALYDKPKAERKDPLSEDDADNGQGKKTIYRVVPEGKGTRDERIQEKNDGFVFNSGDSYVIVYKYRSKQARGKEKAIIYFWIGNDSEQQEHGAAALVASDIDTNQFGDDAIQIRVTEAREPPHFMKIFGGYIMIRQPQFDNTSPRLFHIRGKEGNIKVVEVAPSASNLNSNDCFVLRTSRKKVYIWLGKGSLGDEQRIAEEAAKEMFGNNIDPTKLSEGKNEPQAFWDTLGGRQAYHNILETNVSSQVSAEREPRLFRLFNIRGSMEVEEIIDFGQDDLIGDDVYYLDVFTTIYVWLGKDSTKDERVAANEYLKAFIEPSGRATKDVLIIMVAQGKEANAPGFKGYFGAWEEHRQEKLTYEEMKKLAAYETPKMSAADHMILLQEQQDTRYSYEQLQSNEGLPDYLDLTKKEVYLHDNEFQALFGMSLQAFCEKPEWKQIELKKRVNLF